MNIMYSNKNAVRVTLIEAEDLEQLINKINSKLRQRGFYQLHGPIMSDFPDEGGTLFKQMLLFTGPINAFNALPGEVNDETDPDYYYGSNAEREIYAERARRIYFYLSNKGEMKLGKPEEFLDEDSVYHVKFGYVDQLKDNGTTPPPFKLWNN